MIPENVKQDLDFILSKKLDNGSDLWAGPDKNIGKGSPFSTRDAAIILTELGLNREDQLITAIAELIFEHQQKDGRFRISASGAIYPCHTIGAFRVLCYLGFADDPRLDSTKAYVLGVQEPDGGWKCNKYSFGRGPETEYSNPGPTLEALDALRFMKGEQYMQASEKAIEFLLWHWEHKQPVGPCLYGIGSLFLKTEFPFFRYNIFYYTYVLSFYKTAVNDPRFTDAFHQLKNKLTDGKMVIENPNRKLAGMNLCKKGAPGEQATLRFQEICENVKRHQSHM